MHIHERLAHHALELRVHFGDRPEEALQILHPFEIADRHAAGVRQDVGYQQNPLARQHFVRMRSGRSVGRLANDLRLDLVRIIQRDHVFQRRGNQNFALHRQQIVVRNPRSARHAHYCPGAFLVPHRLQRIDPARIENSAARIADRHHPRLLLRKQPRGLRTGIAESLNRHARSAQGHLLHLTSLFDHHQASARRRILATFAAADRHRLAGHHAESRKSLGHRVGIHHPGHRLRIGIDVRRRNILLGPDQRQNFRRIAPRHPLELWLAHPLRIANHAALAAAKGNVRSRRLPRHPHRQRLHFIRRNSRMVAKTALRRSARHVVLHAIAGKNLHLPVIHLRGDGNFQHALGRAQDLPQSRIQLQVLSGKIELNLSDAKRVQVLARRDSGYGLGSRLRNRRHFAFLLGWKARCFETRA